MQKIIYWLQWSWKTSVWKKISEWEKIKFVDLDDYIVHNKLNHNSVSEFIQLFDSPEKWWETFRHFEYTALKEVLEEWYEVISVGWWTLSFDRNIEILSDFEVIKIFLEVDIKEQVDRLIDDNELWKYRSIADWIIDTSNSSIDEVVSMAKYKIWFLEWIVPLRNQIDTIDNELISILQTGKLLNINIPEININFKTEKTTNDTYNFIENNQWSLENSNRIIKLFKYRFSIVQQIWELKRKYNETLVQWNRKEQVRNKWVSWWEKLWKIYDFIHEKALEIE